MCILKTKAELDQLKSGLTALGVGKAMEDHQALMASLFVSEKMEHLTAGKWIYSDYTLTFTFTCILLYYYYPVQQIR